MVAAVTCFLLFEIVGAVNHVSTYHFLLEHPQAAFADLKIGILNRVVEGYRPCAIRETHASIERRRDFVSSKLIAAYRLCPWLLATSFPRTANAEENIISYRQISSSRKIAQYIHNSCNSFFLSCVIRSDYNFLYRGLSSNESEAVSHTNYRSAIIVNDEPYDLLSTDTYNSKKAVTYFQGLERGMIAKGVQLKPSNSHLATTCPKDAAQWGTAASIWPLGEKGVEFAWMEDGGLFWNGDERGMRNVLTSNGRNYGLAYALQGDAWEIMFRSDNGFIAVPAELDEELRAHLRRMRK